ncbi:MAG: ligand-binding sensor domain-containing protein [Ferruginibacter sp.]
MGIILMFSFANSKILMLHFIEKMCRYGGVFTLLMGFSLSFTVGFAQLPLFETTVYPLGKGNEKKLIRCITKDQQGFLWMANENGLARFDGNMFTYFQHRVGDAFSLAHNYIHKIYCDKKGRIWVSNNSGISMFLPATQQFKNYLLVEANPYLAAEFLSFQEDELGRIWVGNQNGLVVLDPNTGTSRDCGWKHLMQQEGSTQLFASVYSGNVGLMWVMSKKYLYQYNIYTNTYTSFPLPPLANAGECNIIHVDTLSHKLFIGTYFNGMWQFDYHLKKWTAHSTNADWHSTPTYDPILDLQPYSEKYAACYNEITVGFFDLQQQQFFALKDYKLLQGLSIYSLLVDGKYIWLGTPHGLILMKPTNNSVENITPKNNGYGSYALVQFAAQQQKYYTVNYGSAVPYQFIAQQTASVLPTSTDSIKGLLRAVLNDQQGNEWLSTENDIYLLKSKQKIWQKVNIQESKSTTVKPQFRNFIQDKQGKIWVSTRNAGIYTYSTNLKQFVEYHWPISKNNSVVTAIIYDTLNHTIWVGEKSHGLLSLNLTTQKWTIHPLHLYTTHIEPSDIALGQGGVIWVADLYNGLSKFQTQNFSIELLSSLNDLPSNVCEGVEVDSSGNVWIFSSETVTKYFPKTAIVLNYFHPEFTKIQQLVTDNRGYVYVTTAVGIFRLNADEILPPKVAPKLYIERIDVLNTIMDSAALRYLSATQNDISFSLGALNLYSETNPMYEYRWNADTTWKALGLKNNIRFSQLNSGQYTVQFRLKNDHNPKQWITYAWQISLPWWKEPILIGILAILVLVGIFLFIKRRFHLLQQKAKLQQRMVEIEMAALRAQMNPHFIFNCINCIDSMVQEGDKYNATTYLNKFARLIRNVLDSSRVSTISLAADIETLRLYVALESLRMEQGFSYQININENLLLSDFQVPSLIVQPFVENAILHGIKPLKNRDGILTIDVTQEDAYLRYVITDNGVGRNTIPTSSTHKSYGMDITAARIRMFNGEDTPSITITDLKDDSGNPSGTKVEVWLNLI